MTITILQGQWAALKKETLSDESVVYNVAYKCGEISLLFTPNNKNIAEKLFDILENGTGAELL